MVQPDDIPEKTILIHRNARGGSFSGFIFHESYQPEIEKVGFPAWTSILQAIFPPNPAPWKTFILYILKQTIILP